MPKSNKTVVVFHMHGCPACSDYLPRFKRVAVRYRNHVPIKQVLLTPANDALANKYRIKAAPTTCVLDAAGKALKKIEGSLPVAEIEKLFVIAATG